MLQKLALADVWVVLDDVQFSPRDYQHRALLQPTHRGQAVRWVTLPIDRSSGSRIKISEARIACDDPAQHLWRALSGAFLEPERLFSYFRKGVTALRRLDSRRLTPYALATSLPLLEIADRVPHILFASQLRRHACPKGEGIAQLLRLVGGRVYLADSGARAYLDAARLSRVGVTTLWQEWRPVAGWSAAPEIQRNGAALNLLAADPTLFRAVIRDASFSESF